MPSYEKEKDATAASPPSPGGIEAGHDPVHDETEGLTILGYRPELKRNRSMFTLLFQSLAIAAVRLRSGRTSGDSLLKLLPRYRTASAVLSSAPSTAEVW